MNAYINYLENLIPEKDSLKIVKKRQKVISKITQYMSVMRWL